ncbi:MAG: sigma-70 family RNA polymerase sigma factor [Romboutsia timonensis]
MNNYKGFTNEELVILAQQGNREAKEALIANNDKLVRYCVNRFFKYESNEFCFDELYNEAIIGMMAAIKNFDPDHGTVFCTFAVSHMCGRIKLALRSTSNGKAFRVGRDQKMQYSKVLDAEDKLRQSLLREPTIEELAKEVEMDIKYVEWLIMINNNHCSMQEVKFENKHSEQDNILIIDSLENKDNPDEEQIVMNTILREALDKLPDKDKKIIELRYFKGMTQKDTAEKLNTSQCLISRHEKKILEKLKKALGGVRYDD